MSSLKCKFITPDDPKWTGCLTRLVHDFYHKPGYVQLCAEWENAVPLAFYAEEGDSAGLIPLLRVASPTKAAVEEEWCHLTSPYGYACPLMTCPEDRGFTGRFMNSLRIHADAIGASSIFLRLHPILSAPLRLPSLPFAAKRYHSATVSVDLTVSEEETWRQMRNSHRHEIRRLERMGFSLIVDDWQRYGDFIRMYRETMTRVHADPFYAFDNWYFERLRDLLGDSLHVCFVVSPEGVLAAAALFTTVGHIAEYYLSASNQLFRRLAPTKLLIHRLGSWSRARGCSVLHLGGGVGSRQDQLFSFKAGFSPRRHEFATVRMIVNEERYRILTERMMATFDIQNDLQAEFFPFYRVLKGACTKFPAQLSQRPPNA